MVRFWSLHDTFLQEVAVKIDEKDWLFWSKKCWHNLVARWNWQFRCSDQRNGTFQEYAEARWFDRDEILSGQFHPILKQDWRGPTWSWAGRVQPPWMPWGFKRLAGQDDVQSVAAGKTDHCLVGDVVNSEFPCVFLVKSTLLKAISYKKPWNEADPQSGMRHERAIFFGNM